MINSTSFKDKLERGKAVSKAYSAGGEKKMI